MISIPLLVNHNTEIVGYLELSEVDNRLEVRVPYGVNLSAEELMEALGNPGIDYHGNGNG